MRINLFYYKKKLKYKQKYFRNQKCFINFCSHLINYKFLKRICLYNIFSITNKHIINKFKSYSKIFLSKLMNKDRGAQIKQRQQQNKRLEQQTKRMQQQLEKIRMIKQMENERLKLEQEMKQLDVNQKKKEKIKQDTTTLRGYGTKVAKKHNEKVEKKIKQLTKQLYAQQQSSQDDGKQQDGQNVRYFLQVINMQKYYQKLKQNKILTLQKLKAVKQNDLKKLDIPLKDMVVINKKLRTMGIN